VRIPRRHLWYLAAASAAAAVTRPASALDYPTRPVRFISDSAPGSAIDVTMRVIVDGIGRVWETKAFEVRDVLVNEHSVAMFGSFTYKTRTLGKEITSPFALLAKVTGDKISYIQFMEDTFGTASTFRASGTWHFRGVATGGDVSVGS